RPEWKQGHHELVGRADKWALLQAASVAVAWGPDGLATRAVAEAEGAGFAELSMVVGLLAWLAWDVETDIRVASQQGGLQGLEDEQWHAVQLLAVLGSWLVEDDAARTILDTSVARTPRLRVDGERWIEAHYAALEAFTRAAEAPDPHGELG